MNRCYPVILASLMVCLSCRQDGPVIRPHSERDSLEYLVENADLIAVVDIANSIEVSKPPPRNLPPVERASVIRVLKGNAKPNTTISISRLPSVLPKGVSHTELALGNGRHLAFLKIDINSFAPVTDHSVLREPSSSPIWRRDADTDVLRWSEQTTFEQVIADVTNEIKKENTPNKPSEAIQ